LNLDMESRLPAVKSSVQGRQKNHSAFPG